MIDILNEARDNRDYIIELRRDFHSHPELSLQEFRTTERIEVELEKFGIKHKRVSETGVVGILEGDLKSENEVALRADIDALPILEIKGREYGSNNPGVMHACGHDSHTAMLLGAAKILSEHKSSLKGKVRFLFQPAEEIGAGGKIFVNKKCDTLGKANRILGIHCAPDLRSGTIGIKKGINNASVDHFTIKITGKEAHVCKPEEGVDALYIASQIVIALQGIVSRMTSPIEPVIIGVGKLEAGTAYNIVAGSAVLEGTTRNVSDKNRKKVNTLINDTAKSIAKLYGGDAIVEWEDFASVLVNPEVGCDEAIKAVRGVFGNDLKIKTDRDIYLSGDDFCEYQKEIEGVYVYLGTGNPDVPGSENPYHTFDFDIDENALEIGAAIYAGYADWVLNNLD